MKKWIGLVLGLMFLAFSGCASSSSAMRDQTEKATAAEAFSSAARAVSDSGIQYASEKFGFSFQIPDSWESENYTVTVTEKAVKGTDGKIPAVSFLFQDDTENPLLTIQMIPQSSWNDINTSASSGGTPGYLGTRSNVVYCYTIAQTCPYAVGEKADLFNSMMLPNSNDEIAARFQFLDRDGGAVLISSISQPS
ncbi:MAG: hypothetical protein GX424_09760 [Clostridiales bacterium]|jgi:hypothetical protein|nr:hypothetical protein [Clostridiales bacterium]